MVSLLELDCSLGSQWVYLRESNAVVQFIGILFELDLRLGSLLAFSSMGICGYAVYGIAFVGGMQSWWSWESMGLPLWVQCSRGGLIAVPGMGICGLRGPGSHGNSFVGAILAEMLKNFLE